MDSLFLIRSDDHVQERGAGLEKEDGIVITCTIMLAKCFFILFFFFFQ